MLIKLNIFVLLVFFALPLAACGGKQYEIELLAPDAGTAANEADSSQPDEGGPALEQQAAEVAPVPCFVHICGAVASPGVYEVPSGSRIFEVLELAGGFTAEAATDAVNLAAPVLDGSKIAIPTVAEAEAAGAAIDWVSNGDGSVGTAGVNDYGGGGSTDLVNINTASREALMTLPGIGAAKADSIILYREENGGFKAIEDLMKITGIKDGVFSKIKDKIRV
ncbi:MAG: helix-hairpin-helix domain-containing protein [Lachnospiraceae bacterium]|jgi:competence protein ComEA|nr:helix-hairpin-helix domain-containing protein [Lachnospiraceae bacterium]